MKRRIAVVAAVLCVAACHSDNGGISVSTLANRIQADNLREGIHISDATARCYAQALKTYVRADAIEDTTVIRGGLQFINVSVGLKDNRQQHNLHVELAICQRTP